VVLSGLGGDEIFWGYPGFRRAPSWEAGARPRRVRGRAGDGTARECARLSASREARVSPGGPGSRTVPPGPRPLLPRQAARLLGAGRLPLWAAGGASPPLTGSLYGRLDIAHYLQDQLLRDTDVFGMAHSLEVRMPFLDHRLAELVLALPERYLASGEPTSLSSPTRSPISTPRNDRTAQTRLRAAGRALDPADVERDPLADRAPRTARAESERGGRGRLSRQPAPLVARLGHLRALGMRRHGALPSWPDAGGIRKVLFLVPGVQATGGIQRYGQALLRATGEAFPRAAIRVLSLNDGRTDPDGRMHVNGAGPRTKRLSQGEVRHREPA